MTGELVVDPEEGPYIHGGGDHNISSEMREMLERGASFGTIDEAIEVYGPRYGHKLSREDGREIVTSLLGVMKLLVKWDKPGREDQRTPPSSTSHL